MTAETDGPREPAPHDTGELPPLDFSDVDGDDEEEAGDLAGFIRGYAAPRHHVAEVVDAVCAKCSSATFRVLVSGEAAERVCTFCGNEHYMFDSANHWDSDEAAECECPCGGEEFSVAAGLVDGYEPWVYVGMRCLRDGTVGVYADWRTGDFSVADLSGLV